jgi:eukaryotic-like serine/threonine-protein kinase
MPTQPTQALLTVAARSIAAASGAAVPDLVRDRALRHYGEALRQYLTIRVGSRTRGSRAWMGLLARAAGDAVADGVPPRAHLFRIAREVADRMGPPSGPPVLPWRAPRAPGVHPDVLDALRAGLTEEEAELLELRYARELPPDEMAVVLDRPVEWVLEALASATERAREVTSPTPAPLRELLLEAFALEGRDEASLAAYASKEGLVPGTVLGSRYAIQERVGTGAFGDVYRAQDTEVPGHVVALKLLHQPAWTEEARTAALRELHLIASVFHPSVVQFKDHGWHGERLWFVMPWYDGETLEERMTRCPLDRGEARRIFEPLARALAAMHAAGIRHQDVKPDNIFLARIPGFGGRNGHDQVLPILLDLGVAAKEAEMVVAGTPTYFAPEVAAQFAYGRDEDPGRNGGAPPGVELHKVGPAADVFALALALRNALEPETQPDVPAGAVETFVEERAGALPAMPQSKGLKFLEPTLRRWMSLDPDERPTADELAEELAILTRPEERRRRRNATLRWLAPVSLAVVAVFASVVYGLHTRAERQQGLAEQARRAQQGLQVDLSVSKEQQRALEKRVKRVRDEVAQTRWSRERLSDALARARADREALEETLATTRSRRERLAREVEQRKRALTELEEALAESRREASAASRRADQQARVTARLETDLHRTREALGEAEDRTGALDAEVAALRTRVDAERAKGDRLEREMIQALEARARAEVELRRLRQAEAPPTPSEDPDGEGPPADADST